MRDGRRQPDRGVSSTTGLLLFIAIGALMTASGAYLMLELGNQDIGQAATTAFEAEQQGEMLLIKHEAGDSVAGENIRVDGGRVVDIPETVGSGSEIKVVPIASEVVLFFEDGRVSQELLRTEVRLTRLVVTVENENGEPLAGHPVGVYDSTANETVGSASALVSTAEERGRPPAPTVAGTTNQNGEFVVATTLRDELDRGTEYILLVASTDPQASRSYSAETVRLTEEGGEATVRLST